MRLLVSLVITGPPRLDGIGISNPRTRGVVLLNEALALRIGRLIDNHGASLQFSRGASTICYRWTLGWRRLLLKISERATMSFMAHCARLWLLPNDGARRVTRSVTSILSVSGTSLLLHLDTALFSLIDA